jgi:fimbrial chaperone protein
MPFCVIRRAAILAAAALSAAVAPALAAMSLSPVLVELSANKQTELIAVTNDGDTALRLQAELSAWQQTADGETALQPTQDVLVFPPLLTIDAHETKRLRIGAVASAGTAEKSYRLSVQELPAENAQGQTGVRMLTKISIPVFIQPAQLTTDGRIETQPHPDGSLGVRVLNTGTRHFVLSAIEAVGRDGGGGIVFDSKAAGWYVLAGGERDYSLAVSAADCRAARLIELRAKLDELQISASVPLAPDACGHAAKTQISNAGS